jgi:hypothetical protein
MNNIKLNNSEHRLYSLDEIRQISENRQQADCRYTLLDMSIEYGEIIKSGTAHGGSEVKDIPIPVGHKIVPHWAQFQQLNAKGNPVNRTYYTRAFYKINS